MADGLRGVVRRVLEYFSNMTRGQRIRFIVLAALAIVIVISVSMYLTRTEYTILYSGMNPEDAALSPASRPVS